VLLIITIRPVIIDDTTPAHIKWIAESAIQNLLPEKSSNRYWKQYEICQKFKTIQADENSINLDGGRKITIFSFMAVFLSIKQLF
jgi:hypothetical protein